MKLQAPRWVTRAEAEVLGGLAHLKALWKIWNLRSLILMSLALQIILILLAPFRKKTANKTIVVTVWLSYLLADYVAIQAVGLIPNYSKKSSYNADPDMLSFWAPFLLVHLGGPDPITALSLEDNELWLRTALHFFTYVSAAARVFFQSLPNNLLAIPTIFMFCVGFIKYLERTLSLYNARLTRFKSSLLTDQDPEDPNNQPEPRYDTKSSSLPPYKDELDEGEMSVKNNIQIVNQRWDNEDEHYNDGVLQRSNVILVWDAHELFEKFKGVYVDLTFSFHDRDKSRAYFLQPALTPEDAFTILEIELNFTYEVFYTKMIVIHQLFGAWIRRVSFILEVLSLLIWIVFIDKKSFHMFDIWITYTLLVGGVVIDFFAFLMVVLSDWQVAMLSRGSKLRVSMYDRLLSARKRTWGACWEAKESSWRVRLKRLFCRRWSESIRQFNLMDHYARPFSTFTNSMFKYLPPIKDKLQEFRYVSKKWFADDLRDFIFDEIRHKAEMGNAPGDIDEIYSSKGDWVIRALGGLDLDPFVFYKWTVDAEYDKCVLLWHVATEILYQMDEITPEESMYPELCKILSEYMMYLLKWQSEMVIEVAGTSEVRMEDTVKEATLFFDKYSEKKEGTRQEKIRNAYKRLMDEDGDTRPWTKGGRNSNSKSVVLEAVQLAKELRKMKEKTKTVGMWELMAKVWVELLCYAASHIRPSAHAAQLKQGGELLTLVWLLMLHFGLSKNFNATKEA